MVSNNTLDQLDLIDIYRTFHSKTVQYTFISSAHGMISRIGHMLGHKTSLNKLKRIEIISSIFSSQNSMKLEINYRKENGKKTNTRRLDNVLLKNKEIDEETKRKS